MLQWDCWKVRMRIYGTPGKLLLHHKGYGYHWLRTTESIQTAAENIVQDAKYLESGVRKLSPSNLKIV
jgi:hypothetical protein